MIVVCALLHYLHYVFFSNVLLYLDLKFPVVMYFFAEKTQKIIKSLKALTNKIFVHIFVVTDFTVTKTIPGKSAIN